MLSETHKKEKKPNGVRRIRKEIKYNLDREDMLVVGSSLGVSRVAVLNGYVVYVQRKHVALTYIYCFH